VVGLKEVELDGEVARGRQGLLVAGGGGCGGRQDSGARRACVERLY